MGLIKENGYDPEDWQITEITKAIAHPARKRIVETLLKMPHTRNIDFMSVLNMSQPAVSTHLHSLAKAGVIKYEYYIHFNEIRVVPETLEILIEYLEDVVMKVRNGEKKTI